MLKHFNLSDQLENDIMNIEFEDILNVDNDIIERVRNWRNTEEIKKYMINDHYIDKNEHNIWIKNLRNKNTMKAWLIKYEKKYIGLVYLLNINYEQKTTDWGFYIADKSERGKGIGSISLYKLIEYVFNEMKFNEMETIVLCNNTIIKLYKKFGFKIEKKLKNYLLKNNKYIDVFVMKLLRSNWKNLKSQLNCI